MAWKKVKLWFDEHFPIHHFVAGASLYLLVRAVVELTFAQSNLIWNILDFCGILIPTKHFYLRQVLAAHRGTESSKIHKLGLVSIIVQIASFFLMSPSTLSIFLFISLWVWTGIEFRDFFMPSYLIERFLLREFLDLLVIPFLGFLLFSLLREHGLVGKAWVYMLVQATAVGWLFVFVSKLKGTEEGLMEMEAKKMSVILAASFVLVLFVAALFFRSLGFEKFIYDLVLVVLGASSLYGSFRFSRFPVAANRKFNFWMVVLIFAYVFVAPIVVAFC